MSPQDLEYYDGREQTLVKHLILQRYLLRLALITGNAYTSITYIDCFSGPWENKAEDLSDTSFSIAVRELRKARADLEARGKSLKLRCFFLEKDKGAFQKLNTFCSQIRPGIEAKAKNDILENSVKDIMDFQREAGPSNFTFVFFDPTGWTGIELDVIGELLRISPGEVVINYMTSFIKRFIESPKPELIPSFDRLYGGPEFRDKLKTVPFEQREETMVRIYSEKIKHAGNFKYVCYTPVFQAQIAAVHFHLIYGTRHPAGLEVFKKEEREAVKTMEEARARTQQTKRESKGTLELFPSVVMHDSSFYDGLRNKSLDEAVQFFVCELSTKKKVPYDVLWARALQTPLVWVKDLNDWLSKMTNDGKIRVLNMERGQKVPKRNSSIEIEWLA